MKESLWVFLLVSEPKFDRSSVRRLWLWMDSICISSQCLPSWCLLESLPIPGPFVCIKLIIIWQLLGISSYISLRHLDKCLFMKNMYVNLFSCQYMAIGFHLWSHLYWRSKLFPLVAPYVKSSRALENKCSYVILHLCNTENYLLRYFYS